MRNYNRVEELVVHSEHGECSCDGAYCDDGACVQLAVAVQKQDGACEQCDVVAVRGDKEKEEHADTHVVVRQHSLV